MKEKQIHIRIDKDFAEKLEYLKKINGFRTLSETIRKVIEKEYRREKSECVN
jgi:predicted DNA-binding protein